MKNLLLTLVGFLFTANLFAQTDPQKADTVFGYDWENNGWVLTMRCFNTYGEGCQPGSLTYQDLVNGLWINTFKELYTYDASGRVSVQIEQSWDTISNSFENYVQYTFTYNAAGNVTLVSTETTETWEGSAWKTDNRYTCSYDDSGYLTSTLHEGWFGGSWVNSFLETYIRNSNGTVQELLARKWNEEASEWENDYRYTNTYNDEGERLTQLEEFWMAGAWVTYEQGTYTYSGNNLTNYLVEFNDGNGGWEIDHQVKYTYNGNGTISQSTDQGWNEDQGIWVNSERQDYVYTTGCAFALPLTLLNFTGTKNNNSVLLTWKTANEINTSHFSVQRSLDAVDFSDIKTVPATPGSVTKTYSFTDNVAGIKAPEIYYRLKMIDKDGNFEMSNVVLVTLENQGLRFTIRPNPAKNYFVITYDDSAPLDALVTITDFSGRSVFKQTITPGGRQELNISALPKGVYVVIINTGDNITTQKLVIE
jgi:hypothetical protein